MTKYPYIIIYQYFRRNFLFERCYFDFVKGRTLDEAKAVLEERSRSIPNLQVLSYSKEIE